MIEPLMGRHFHMIAMVFQCPLECISPSIGEAFASIGEAFPPINSRCIAYMKELPQHPICAR